MSNNAKKDQNFVSTLLGVSNSDGATTVPIYADPVTHRLLVDLAGTASGVDSINTDATAAQVIAAGTGITVTDNGTGTHTIANTGLVPKADARVTNQTAAATNIANFTVGAADGTFLVSGNVNVTASTVNNFTMTCAYTDETNSSRTLVLNFSNIAGSIGTAITNALGAGAYEGIPLQIRAKASTTITLATTGTFTTVTYNAEGTIIQIA
jgi:hypothetical protein